jgi:hypothetical protein
MPTPSSYASRYLPVNVPNDLSFIPVRIERYHLGPPSTPAQQQLWSALGDHFSQQKKKNPGYELTLTVNSAPFSVGSREQIRMPSVRPFWGKGSPEDCQVVLQLALLFNLTTALNLQKWANDNLGLDCNGFAGNYIFHGLVGNPWWLLSGGDEPGPSQTIDKLFAWAAMKDESLAVQDLDDLDPQKTYMIVRTDQSGRVIPGPNPVGHIALTEPGQFIPSYSSMDLTRANDNMIGNTALRTVESAGEKRDGVSLGLHKNWMVFIRSLKPKGVFEVNRDNIRKADTVKLAPLP